MQILKFADGNFWDFFFQTGFLGDYSELFFLVDLEVEGLFKILFLFFPSNPRLLALVRMCVICTEYGVHAP